MQGLTRRQTARLRLALALACVFVLGVGATAYAFYDDYYGGYNICGNNCYVVASGGNAHTFVYNAAAIGNGGYMACQLFN